MNTEQVKIDWKKGEEITDNGKPLYIQMTILRKFSKFLTGGKEDVVVPLTVFVNADTGKICLEGLPFEVAEYCEKYNKEVDSYENL